VTEDRLPSRLQEIVEDFGILQGREKLEYLLQFAEALPPLPDWLEAERESMMNQVHECMTPVFIYAHGEGHGRAVATAGVGDPQ
jgi:cysteine desulfuration protein SufE